MANTINSNTKNKKQSWNKQYPRLSGLLISIALLLTAFFGIDKLLPQYKQVSSTKSPRLANRAIVLRENHPGLDIVIDPEDFIKKTDGWYDKHQEVRSRNLADMENQFSNALNTLLDICKYYNITPVLMTQANRFKTEPDAVILEWMNRVLVAGINYEDFKLGYNKFNSIVRNIAKDGGVTLINLDYSVPNIHDSVHCKDKGSQLVSKIISNELIDLINRPF